MNRKQTVLTIISVIFVIGVILFFSYSKTWHNWRSRRVNDIKQEYIIQNANVRVQSYEWFYVQYEEIKATRIKAEIAAGLPEEVGIKMVLADMIAEYNARAEEIKTRGQWKANDLPNRIDY